MARAGPSNTARVGGAYFVSGAIMTYWAKAGSTLSKFGFPTSDVKPITGGTRGTFEHGSITWHRKTNTYTVTMN